MKNNLLSKDNFINSNKFAHFSDTVFSQNISFNEKHKLKDSQIMYESNNPQHQSIIYKKKILKISNNSTIFTHSNYIKELFTLLKKFNEIENLTLITTQSDRTINKNLYLKKPDNIINWFSINNEVPEYIKSIPLGLANDFSKKNINNNDLNDLAYENYKKKEANLYLNFNINTNPLERSYLFNYFKNFEWAFLESDLNKKDYIEGIQKSTFVLCPYGNGYDTHRIWEALYSGSIPVVKENKAFNQFKDLPILFINSYENVTKKLLENYLMNFNVSNYNFEKLDIGYWRKEFAKNQEKDAEFIISLTYENIYFSTFYLLGSLYNKNMKLLKTLFFKIFFKINKMFNFKYKK